MATERNHRNRPYPIPQWLWDDRIRTQSTMFWPWQMWCRVCRLRLRHVWSRLKLLLADSLHPRDRLPYRWYLKLQIADSWGLRLNSSKYYVLAPNVGLKPIEHTFELFLAFQQLDAFILHLLACCSSVFGACQKRISSARVRSCKRRVSRWLCCGSVTGLTRWLRRGCAKVCCPTRSIGWFSPHAMRMNMWVWKN